MIETKLHMTAQQSGQVTRIMEHITYNDRDSRFEWCWVEISLHDHYGEITDFTFRGAHNPLATAAVMHLVAKRTLKPGYQALDVYSLLMNPSPPPPFSGGPRGPPPRPPPSAIVAPAPPRTDSIQSVSSDSDSDSHTSISSNDSSVGYVRRKLRMSRARKEKLIARRKYLDDSDSDSEDEDVIRIQVDLKRGDDVVKKLLDLWTAGAEVKGKGLRKME